MRPFNSREQKYCSSLVISMKGQTITEITEMRNGKANINMPPRVFNFDHCFWTHSSEGAVIPDVDPDLNTVTDESVLKTTDPIYSDQAFVYAQIGQPMLDNALKGFNACLFAYGQTGSGKTYSMMGIPSDPGVIPRLCKELFLRASRMKAEHGSSVAVTCTYLEIYNENVRDLLNPSEMDKSLKVRQHPKLGVFVEGLTKLEVGSEEEIGRLLDDGGKVRHVAATNMNASSSRSHAILTLSILVKDKDDGEVGSSLNLVDLAGSERAAATGAEGATLVEGANINKSLTTLGMCLSRLADAADGKNKGHIPYRDSQLTWILNDSLGGNSKTAMLANISPASINYEETLSTLRFAMTVKKIKNNAVINEDPQQRLIRELRAEIEEIKIKISELEAGIVPEHAESGDGTEDAGDGELEDVLDAEGNVVAQVPKRKKKMTVEEQELEQLEALEHATKLMEEAAESSDEKKKRVAAAKAEHEKAMLAFSKASGVYVDNSLCKLVTLNEDLHAFPSVALLYYLKQGANRIGCGADRKKVLVKVPREQGREVIALHHAMIECDALQKKVFIRLCTQDEQPEAGSGVVESMDDTLLMTTRRHKQHNSPTSTAPDALLSTMSGTMSATMASTVTLSHAAVYVNGVELKEGETVQLHHKDRIMVGLLAFRHSQPASWFIEGLDEDFSRNVASFEHNNLLEHHVRLEIAIEEERTVSNLWADFQRGKIAITSSEAEIEVEEPVVPELEGHDERVSMLMFQAGECENALVEQFPMTDAMKAEQLAAAAATDSGVDLDYAFAVRERDENLKRLLQQRQVQKRDEELSRLREQEKQGEVEIERLKEQLAEQQRARAEATQRRQEEEEGLEKEKAAQQLRKRAATDKASSLQQLAIELQRYEEEVRNATTWKPMGPASNEDQQEYASSQKPPTFAEIFGENGSELALPAMSVQKMRLEKGVFSALRSGWHKVFLLVRPRFMYYFTKNEPKAPAAGAAFLYGCDLQIPEAPLEKQNFPLRVVPCVPRGRSKSSKGETEDNNVLLAFESEADRQQFKAYVESMYRPVCPPRVAAYLKEQEGKDEE